jgi:hypothetical protein
MNPLRQIEAAELLINANNFSISYASAILAGTPQAQLVTPQTPKRLKGMTAEAIARMERELSRLQEAISSIQDSYGQDHLHLTVVKGYLRELITNDRVAHYLEQYQPELFIEFQKIAEIRSGADKRQRFDHPPPMVTARLAFATKLGAGRVLPECISGRRRCAFAPQSGPAFDLGQ